MNPPPIPALPPPWMTPRKYHMLASTLDDTRSQDAVQCGRGEYVLGLAMSGPCTATLHRGDPRCLASRQEGCQMHLRVTPVQLSKKGKEVLAAAEPVQSQVEAFARLSTQDWNLALDEAREGAGRAWGEEPRMRGPGCWRGRALWLSQSCPEPGQDF